MNRWQQVVERLTGSRQTEKLIESLLDVSETLASAEDFDHKFRSVCAAAVKSLNCDRSSIFLFEEGRFRGRYNVGNPPDIAALFESHSTTMRDPIVAAAFNRRSGVFANNVRDGKTLMNQRLATAARIHAIVVAPMFYLDDTPSGFITAEYNERKATFDDLDQRLTLGFAKLAETVVQARTAAAEAEAFQRGLENASRLDALSRLSAAVAHDLNNRLTVILGVAELLRAKYGDQLIEELQLAASASAALNRSLVEFASGAGDNFGECNASDVLADLEYTLRQLAFERSELHVSTIPDVHVACSASQLQQIITSLVIFACDSVSKFGTVSVRLYLADQRIEAPDDLDYAVIEIADNGEGIPVEQLERLFEPFFATRATSTDPFNRGPGLALAAVHGVVAAIGGEVRVDSDPGLGSTFQVLIPRAHRSEPAAPRAPIESPPRQPVSILLTDNDEPVRSFVASALSAAGHLVVEAASAAQALKALEHKPDIDVLLTDIVMPVMNGTELATAIRERLPALPIMFISAYFPHYLRQELPGTGAVAFLAKPFSPKALEQKIAELLGLPERRNPPR